MEEGFSTSRAALQWMERSPAEVGSVLTEVRRHPWSVGEQNEACTHRL